MWYQRVLGRYLQYNTPLLLEPKFYSNVLTVDAALDQFAALPYGKRTYKYAGYLTPIFDEPGIGVHKGKLEKLYLGKRQIRFDNPLKYKFSLQLTIHLWTPQLDLTIWESDEEPILSVEAELGIMQVQLDRIEDSINARSKI